MPFLIDLFKKKVFGTSEDETEEVNNEIVETVETNEETVNAEPEIIEEEETVIEETANVETVEPVAEETTPVVLTIPYTTSDEMPVKLYKDNVFGANITINNGHELLFDAPIDKIGHAAFCHNRELTSVVIPEGIKKIESSAFQNCISLTKITFPSSVEKFGGNVFFNISEYGDLYVSGNTLMEQPFFNEVFGKWNIHNI